MAGVFGFVMVVGAIGTSGYYWVTYGRYEDFLIGRMKTAFAFFVWYLFLVYLYVDRERLARRRADIEAAHHRI
jgi:hypothetical protein